MIQFKNYLICLSFSVASCLLAIQSVYAESLSDQWNYTSDSPADSIRVEDGNYTVGNTIYEIYGTGIKQDDDYIWVGINSNLPLTGLDTEPTITAPNGTAYEISNENIGHGDFFFDFSGLGSFKAASDSNSLFAVHFAESNDSGVSEVGVYNSVTAKSVVADNAGWSNLFNHNSNGVFPLTNNSATMGDLAWDDDYYSAYNTEAGNRNNPDSLIPNVIDSGNKIGDITLLDQDELISAGFDSSNFIDSGEELFGFKIDRNLLPDGDFIATLIHECNNDATAIEGLFTPPPPPKPVPEAGTNLGIIVLGLFGLGWQLKHKKPAS
ncbi:MAG: XDD3 family exosortase-dependent surface protein [Microcoleaceae cyanobacterium]